MAGKGDRNRVSDLVKFRDNYEVAFNGLSFENVIILGDTHGEWSRLFAVIERLELSNCLIIHVGDIGVGYTDPRYHNTTLSELENYNELFKKSNNTFFGIRGNHDNPSWFDGSVDFTNLKLLPDYTNLKINKERYLFVGGAISIDRLRNKVGESYWEDEGFVFDKSKASKCDVLITHTAPSHIGAKPYDPSIKWAIDGDSNLLNDLITERVDMDKLIDVCKPKYHYCGHFHRSEHITKRNQRDEITSHLRILDICELYKHS